MFTASWNAGCEMNSASYSGQTVPRFCSLANPILSATNIGEAQPRPKWAEHDETGTNFGALLLSLILSSRQNREPGLFPDDRKIAIIERQNALSVGFGAGGYGRICEPQWQVHIFFRKLPSAWQFVFATVQ